jgi:hypothetical protein
MLPAGLLLSASVASHSCAFLSLFSKQDHSKSFTQVGVQLTEISDAGDYTNTVTWQV